MQLNIHIPHLIYCEMDLRLELMILVGMVPLAPSSMQHGQKHQYLTCMVDSLTQGKTLHKLSTTPLGDLDRSLFFVYNRFVAFEMRFYEPYED